MVWKGVEIKQTKEKHVHRLSYVFQERTIQKCKMYSWNSSKAPLVYCATLGSIRYNCSVLVFQNWRLERPPITSCGEGEVTRKHLSGAKRSLVDRWFPVNAKLLYFYSLV